MEEGELPKEITAHNSPHVHPVLEHLVERATQGGAVNAVDPREEEVGGQPAVNRGPARSVESLSPANSFAHWMEPFTWIASSVV